MDEKDRDHNSKCNIQASCMKLENSSSVKCICHVAIKEDPNGNGGKRISMSVKQKPNSQASENRIITKVDNL